MSNFPVSSSNVKSKQSGITSIPNTGSGTFGGSIVLPESVDASKSDITHLSWSGNYGMALRANLTDTAIEIAGNTQLTDGGASVSWTVEERRK